MIYLFGTGYQVSIVFDESYLSEEEKLKATKVLEHLPEKPEQMPGKSIRAFIDSGSLQFSWVYNDLPLIDYTKLKLAVDAGLVTPAQYLKITGSMYP